MRVSNCKYIFQVKERKNTMNIEQTNKSSPFEKITFKPWWKSSIHVHLSTNTWNRNYTLELHVVSIEISTETKLCNCHDISFQLYKCDKNAEWLENSTIFYWVMSSLNYINYLFVLRGRRKEEWVKKHQPNE